MSNIGKFYSERPYIPSLSPVEKEPQAKQHLTERRIPARPQRSSPMGTAPIHTNTNTIRLFNFEFVFTDRDWENLINTMVDMFPQVFAAMLVGLDFERHAIAFRVGAFTLDLYAVGEALVQSVVLAVLQRLLQLFRMKLGFPMGRGVVVVGGGVRVLFAFGVRLRGFEDLNEVVVLPLRELIG